MRTELCRYLPRLMYGGLLAGTQMATAQSTVPQPTAPVDMSLTGLFEPIGPVRWGILALAAVLICISIAGLMFLTKPITERQKLASALTSLKQWNTVMSTLLTILGPIGTFIGMIGALIAMHQVAVATDSVARLAAQADFFQKAAEMFISSLAGIGLGMSLGLSNNLILYHVLPDHEHQIHGNGMIASTFHIIRQWGQKCPLLGTPKSPEAEMEVPLNTSVENTMDSLSEERTHEDSRAGVDRTDHDRSIGLSGRRPFFPLRFHRSRKGSEEPADGPGDHSDAGDHHSVVAEPGQGPGNEGQQNVKQT